MYNNKYIKLYYYYFDVLFFVGQANVCWTFYFEKLKRCFRLCRICGSCSLLVRSWIHYLTNIGVNCILSFLSLSLSLSAGCLWSDMSGGTRLENANPLIFQRSGERLVTAADEDEDVSDPIDDREIFDILSHIILSCLI